MAQQDPNTPPKGAIHAFFQRNESLFFLGYGAITLAGGLIGAASSGAIGALVIILGIVLAVAHYLAI